MTELERLNKIFGQGEQISFESNEEGFIMVVINNHHAQARISSYGGQVLSYRPHNTEQDLLFLSEKAIFASGKAIRGGSPICWPWFGDDTSGFGRPSHGFARNQQWQIAATAVNDDGSSSVTLELKDTQDSLAVWPYPFKLSLTVMVGERLELALTSYNTGNKPFTISQALHSYFKVSDIANIQINGLNEHQYLDKLDNFSEKTQFDPVTISQETDRIYLGAPEQVVMTDKGWQRELEIASTGSHTTVIWNPWQDAITAISDLDKTNFHDFVCIETANAANDLITLDENGTHTVTASYRLL